MIRSALRRVVGLPCRVIRGVAARWRASHDRAESEVDQFIRRVKRDFTKEKFVDPITGKLDLRYNPLADDCCILLPCRKCSSMTCAKPEEHFGFSYDDLLKDSRENPS